MGDRDIKWACSHCGATFPTREALAAHVAANHQGHPSEDTPRQDLGKVGASANESELPSNEPRQPETALAHPSRPDAINVAPSEEPTAAPTDIDQGGQASERTRSHHLVKPSLSAIASESSAREPEQPDASLARPSEATASVASVSEGPNAAPALQPIGHRPTAARLPLGWVAVAVICILAAGVVISLPS